MAKIDYSKAGFAKSLNKTMEKSGLTGNAVTAVDIRLDKIDENPDNRHVFNMDEIERLAHTIETDGFSGAIEVYQKEDGRYEISAGHRRYNAMKLLKRETIPAIVKPMPDEITKRKKLIKSNIHHRNMKPMDWARSIAYARETYYMQDAEERGIAYPPTDGKRYYPKLNVMELLEEDFGMKRNQITKYLSLLNLIPELIQMIEDNKVIWSGLSPVSSEEADIQKKIYNELIILYENGTEDDDGQKVLLTKNQIELVTRKYKKKAEQITPEPPKAIEEKIEQVIPVYDDSEISKEPVFDEKTTEEKFDFTGITSSESIESTITLPEPEIKHETEIPVVYIDETIQNVSEQFDNLLNMECQIKDKSSVKKSVEKLRELLDKIDAIMK